MRRQLQESNKENGSLAKEVEKLRPDVDKSVQKNAVLIVRETTKMPPIFTDALIEQLAVSERVALMFFVERNCVQVRERESTLMS